MTQRCIAIAAALAVLLEGPAVAAQAPRNPTDAIRRLASYRPSHVLKNCWMDDHTPSAVLNGWIPPLPRSYSHAAP